MKESPSRRRASRGVPLGDLARRSRSCSPSRLGRSGVVRSGVVIRTDCIVGTVGGRLESSNRSVVIHVVKMLSDDCECQSFGLYTH